MTSQPLSGSSHPLYRQHHTHSFYDITLTICVASFALYKTSQPHFLTSNHHFEDITPTILNIVSTLCHHTNSIDDKTATICMISHPVCVRHSVHCVYDIIPTMYDNTNLCVEHHTRHMYDIICTTEDVTSTLSHQATIFMMAQPFQTWHHTQCIYDIISNMYAITIMLS